MKKEYFILIVIIAALAAYLFMNNTDRTHYELPDLPVIKKNVITGIDLQGPKGHIRFQKKDSGWVLTDDEFKAEQGKVDDMLDTIRNLTVSALVSETSDRNRYHLDDGQRLWIKAWARDKLEREFFIGKPAPTFNHTFIALAGDNRVYHANGSFTRDFDRSVEEFRDKTVLAVTEGQITRIRIEKDGMTKELVKSEKTPPAADGTEPGDRTTDVPAPDDKPAPVWTAADGTAVDPDFAESIASGLSRVQCDRFSGKEKIQALAGRSPVAAIMVNDDIHLKIYGKNEDSLYPALASQTDEAFLLSARTAENFISDIDKILGIKKNEADQETN